MMSEWLSRRLAEQRIIKEEEQGLYQYGISNGLVILLNVFTALMIGLLSGHLVTAIVFTLFFMMLRSYSGGYHSDSRLFCYVTSSAVLLIPVYTSQLMRNIPPMAVISILCLASCIIWQLSPMDSPKRKLDAEERKHFGNRARKILLAELAVFALNPVYEGDALRQRTYTEKQFPFTRKENKGQMNMYLTKDAHPPIITHEEAEAVQSIMEYRSRTLNMNGEKSQNRYLFSGRIICGECGSHFRRQKIYIGKPYEKIIWTCHRHVEDKEFCHMKAIREDVLQQAFTDMWNKLYTNQGTILEPLLKALTELAERKPDSAEIEQLDNEIHSLSEQSRILNQVMKKGYMDSVLFMEKNNQLSHRLTECRRKKTLLARKQKRTKEIVRTEQLIGLVKEEEYQTTFNEELFDLTVREIKISLDHEISIVLKNGLVLTERERGSGDAVAYTNRV